MYDFVQLISAEAGTYSKDISFEKKHMPSIFLISLTKSGLFSHSKSWSSTYMGRFWATVEISSQRKHHYPQKGIIWEKNATHWRQPFCLPFLICGSMVLQASTLFSVQPYRFLHRVTDAQLNIQQPLPLSWKRRASSSRKQAVKPSCSHPDKPSCCQLSIS